MPYQLRHVDETVAISEDQNSEGSESFERLPLEALYELKLNEFDRNTRRFEIVISLCAALSIGAAVAGVLTVLALPLILALCLGAYFARANARLVLTRLSNDKPRRGLRAILRRKRAVRKPGDGKDFVNYA